MSREIGSTCLALALIASSCGQNGPQTPPMQVVSAQPSVQERPGLGTERHPIPLYLNSEVTVSFSADVDPLTVTTDTVGMVKITASGPQKVTMAGRRIGTRTVTLEPEWPVSPELDDGSFQPGQLYRLEVAGLPLTNTVESKTGLPVGNRFVRYYKTVDLDVADPGPMLPEGLRSDPFALAMVQLRMAANSRTLRLHFTRAVDPRTVSANSFRINADVPIESTRVVTVRRQFPIPGHPRNAHPSSTIEIRLAEGHELRAGTLVGVHLRPEGAEEHWIRDYFGRHIPPESAVISGRVSHGAKIELVRFEAQGDHLRAQGDARSGPSFDLEPTRADRLGFEARKGRIQVLARRDVGLGSLGVFRPRRSMTLRPKTAFDPGDGRFRISGPRFEFQEIHIPKDVTVTLSASGPVELLSAGRVRIDGELLLETVHAAEKGEFESPTGDAYLRRVLDSEFGCRIVAAGDLTVRGAIRHRTLADDHRPPLVLIARSLSLHGPIPARTIRAQEPGRVAGGATQTGFPMARAAEPGHPDGHRTFAEATTPWVRLPEDFRGESIHARVDGVRGAVDVFLQIASPDPIDPEKPYRHPSGHSEPRKLPLQKPVEVTGRVHVRFLLRAKVLGGRPLPSVQALVVTGG